MPCWKFEALNRGDLNAFTNGSSELKSLTCNGNSGQHFILNKEHFLLWLSFVLYLICPQKSYSSLIAFFLALLHIKSSILVKCSI